MTETPAPYDIPGVWIPTSERKPHPNTRVMAAFVPVFAPDKCLMHPCLAIHIPPHYVREEDFINPKLRGRAARMVGWVEENWFEWNYGAEVPAVIHGEVIFWTPLPNVPAVPEGYQRG